MIINTEEFSKRREGALEDLINGERGELPASVAIMAIANLNFQGRGIPSKILELIDFSNVNEEDKAVLNKIIDHINNGSIDLKLTDRQRINGSVLQCNEIRGFKPAGQAQRSDVSINSPMLFDKNNRPVGFTYMRDDIELEKFAELDLNGVPVELIFNKYPFAPNHFLFIPYRIPENARDAHNQFLDPEKDERIIKAFLDFVMSGSFGPNIRLGYNSSGAHASANQLHLHGFFAEEKCKPPIEEILGEEKDADISRKLAKYFPGARWIPKSCALPGLKKFLGDMHEEWRKREEKRMPPSENVAYNLYIAPRGVACFPRKHQGNSEYFDILKKCKFTTGYAFMEMAGEIISPTSEVTMFYPNETATKIKDLYQASCL